MFIDPPTTESPPEKLNEQNVIFWSRSYKRLLGLGEKTVTNKARKFLREKKVRYDREFSVFRVDPLKGNKTIHTVRPGKETFGCTCQARKNRATCSHILAVKMWLKIRNWNLELK